MLVTFPRNGTPFIEGGYVVNGLYFDMPMFEGITEEYISNTNLECRYIKFNKEKDKAAFIPSRHYDFFVYQTENCTYVGTDINEIVKVVEDKSLTPNKLAISCVLTFGQVPQGMTLYNQISSFKGPRYGLLDFNSGRFEIKTKTFEPDFRLLEKEYFLEYYKSKLEKIGTYSLFYSGGVDSEFIKFCNPDTKLLTFSYDSNNKLNLLPLFDSLNHIDVHTLNFPGENKAWSIGEGKVVTGYGGDSTFAESDIAYCSFDYFIKNAGGPGAWGREEVDQSDIEILEGFTSNQKTLIGKKRVCGGVCATNTIQWAWKNSKAYVHNILSDPVVASTFHTIEKDYSNRFLLNYVSGSKNTNPFCTEYWEDFIQETSGYIGKWTTEEVLENIETYYGKLKYLIDLYFLTPSRRDKVISYSPNFYHN